MDFQKSLQAQFADVFKTIEDLDLDARQTLANLEGAADKAMRSLEDEMAKAISEDRDASIKRVRAQAANRAAVNGVCPVKAADDAQDFLESGLSHERAVSESAGEYRREAA